MSLTDRFQILKGYQNNHVTIGFGSYGQVKLARDKQSGNIVAVKINKIAKNQIQVHDRLSHPKIIKLIDVYIDRNKEITYMILQYADGGTLYQKIKMGDVTKKQVRKYYRDVCEAVAYLHSVNIMHRDIKPQNILLNKNGQAKLCDFGFAAFLGERKTLCGTYEYMSPQMIQNRPYDYKIDIWALGILLFQMVAGHAPFRGEKPDEVLQQMKTKIFFCQRFQSQDINLIRTILRVTPHKRPSIEQILQQPYFKQYSQSEYGANSTVNSYNSQEKAKINGIQSFHQSLNPKQMIEVQRMVEKQQQKQYQYQKHTYPPQILTKNHNKITSGLPISEPRQPKAYSPLHYNRPINNIMPTQTFSNPYGKPTSSISNQNKSYTNTTQSSNSVNSQIGSQGLTYIGMTNQLNMNKMGQYQDTNNGKGYNYGRLS